MIYPSGGGRDEVEASDAGCRPTEKPIERQRIVFVAINVIGGLAVLGSYAHGLLTYPQLRDQLWGGVPDWLRPVYTAFMLLAASGYFAFTGFILLRIDPARFRTLGGFGFETINALYTCMLFASSLWMPLTFLMLRQPSPELWLSIRVVLAVVGLASIGLLVALLAARIDRSGRFYRTAVAGLVAFCIQTAVLDAVVWTFFFDP